MKNPPPSPRRSMRFMGWGGFNLSPIWALIIVNLALFIVTSVSDTALFNLGLIPDLIAERPWTLLTAMFVHSGFWHFFFNMVALYFFGTTLIRLVGSGRFLLAYFVGGIIGNILYQLLNLSSIGMLVGASGAVYAIAGALVVMIPNMRVALWGIVPMPLWAFVIVFMVLLSLPPFIDTNIAWQAHIGGLAVGLIAGFFFRRRIRYDFYR